MTRALAVIGVVSLLLVCLAGGAVCDDNTFSIGGKWFYCSPGLKPKSRNFNSRPDAQQLRVLALLPEPELRG